MKIYKRGSVCEGVCLCVRSIGGPCVEQDNVFIFLFLREILMLSINQGARKSVLAIISVNDIGTMVIP
jgi:hypothetical protein